MIGGYSFYVLTAIVISLVHLCLTHVVPRGPHLSKSCRPRCKSGTTCVVYRTSNGSPKTDCIWFDPHQMVLDGTVIIPVQNPFESSERAAVTDTNSVSGQHNLKTEDVKPVVNSVNNNTIDTSKTIESPINRPHSNLIHRMTALSKFVGQDLLRDFSSVVKTLDTVNGQNITNTTKGLHSFQDKSSMDKMSDIKKKVLTALSIVTEADGSLTFRRPGRNSNKKNALNGSQVSNKKEGALSTKRTLRNEWQGHMTTPRINKMLGSHQNKRKDPAGHGTVCKPCLPHGKCSTGRYCYYSKHCIMHSCQEL